MGEILRADLEALRVMAAGVRGEAGTISGIDPVDLVASVGRAMPNSAIGSAAVGVGEPLLSALHGMAERLRGMAEAAENGATTYENADRVFAEQLERYLHGPL
ncbi:hypothetical protein HLB23_39005 [Nocardia uniformis]|uniref:Uncharacterized protein n=1 Tax=Nocardia uniformis TaxID=53432 RepID=A0A849CCX3_9NOCA|nr:hypothetical protein [Nocardia uniformis]NNH75776.1 hypothetical protein [Nocardia uniformis]